MTMLALLEQEKEKLHQQLLSAGIMERSQKVLEDELDRILLIYNEKCESSEKREAAACMMQTARMALPLINSLGEVKIWENPEHNNTPSNKRLSLPQLLLAGAAGLCTIGELAIAFQFAMSAASVTTVSWTDSLLLIIFAGAVPALTWFVSSARFSKGNNLKKGNYADRRKRNNHTVAGQENTSAYIIENHLDPEKIYRCLHNMLYVIDRNLDNLSTPQASQAAEFSGNNIPADEIELLADLLEAAASGDGDYAIDRIGDIRYYLHRKGVEIVSYTGNNRELFDFMPAKETSTLRPALICDGKVLKKGLASEGRR